MHASSLRLTVDLIPEAILLAGALVLGILALRRTTRAGLVTWLTVVVLVATAGAQLAYLKGMPDAGYRAYSDGLVVDRYTTFLVPVMCLVALLGVAASGPLLPRIATHVAEYHALVLLAVLGGSLLVAAREMAALWVALELLSLCLVLLVAMHKTDRRGSEAAIKQLVVGGAASAVLLYGFALLYGVGGSTVLLDVADQVRHPGPASTLGMALVVCALLTKLGAVPFHQWLPDTVQGAPPAVVALGVGVGGTAVAGSLARLVVTTFPAQTANWTALIAIVAALSMLYGNIAALTQDSLRRLVGLLVVGQSGVLLLGLLGSAPSQQGVAALIFGLATTGVTVAGMLAVLALLDGVLDDDLDDLRGLSRRSPLGATMLGVGVLSLLGAPPLLGFFAKLFLLQSAVLAGWAWLVVLALVTSVIGAVPAVRLLAVMFVDMPDEDAPPVRVAATATRVAVGFCAAATVLLGILAEPLLNLASGGAGAVH